MLFVNEVSQLDDDDPPGGDKVEDNIALFFPLFSSTGRELSFKDGDENIEFEASDLCGSFRENLFQMPRKGIFLEGRRKYTKRARKKDVVVLFLSALVQNALFLSRRCHFDVDDDDDDDDDPFMKRF
jgi:hypothetical protein